MYMLLRRNTKLKSFKNREMKVIDRSPIKLWFEDPEFLPIMEMIMGYTKVEIPSCYMLYQFAMNSRSTPGMVAEIGVYKGGSARLLAKVFEGSDKQIHLFDTFEGMPEVNKDIDIFKKGSFNDTSLEFVQEYLIDMDGIEFHKGIFPDTASYENDEEYCFVHVDVDILQSVKDCCEYFYPRLSKGGIMIFDDYGYRKCPGAKIAVDEYFEKKDCLPIYLPTGQCVIIK